jgi:hypothetical protein
VGHPSSESVLLAVPRSENSNWMLSVALSHGPPTAPISLTWSVTLVTAGLKGDTTVISRRAFVRDPAVPSAWRGLVAVPSPPTIVTPEGTEINPTLPTVVLKESLKIGSTAGLVPALHKHGEQCALSCHTGVTG